VVAAAREGIDSVELSCEQRARLCRTGDGVRQRLAGIVGCEVQPGFGPILLLEYPSLSAASAAAEGLNQRGILSESPSIARANSPAAIVRLVLTLFHTEDDISQLLSSIHEVSGRL